MAEDYVRYLMANIALAPLSAPNRVKDDYPDSIKIKCTRGEGERLDTLKLLQPGDVD